MMTRVHSLPPPPPPLPPELNHTSFNSHTKEVVTFRIQPLTFLSNVVRFFTTSQHDPSLSPISPKDLDIRHTLEHNLKLVKVSIRWVTLVMLAEYR